MWEYTDKVKEYYTNPKNVGELENPDAVGEAGSLVCGDMLKIFLQIDDNGIITDAKFQTFGCGSAIASSSALTEMIIGKTIEEAEKITNQDIVEFLGGLPNEKIHCSGPEPRGGGDRHRRFLRSHEVRFRFYRADQAS